MDDDYYDTCDLDNLPADLPPALKTLSISGNEFLKNRATIHTKFSEELFGRERKIAIFIRDLLAVTNVLEVSGDTIVMYMSLLHEMLKELSMLHMIGFVDPSMTGALGCGNSTEPSRSLSDAFKRGKPGQIFLVSYNSGDHWILTVVIPTEDLVYYMDPSKRRMNVTTDEWKNVVNQFIKQTNYLIQGTPEQLGDKTCGFLTVVSPTEDLVYYMDPSKRRMNVTTDEWKTVVNQALRSSLVTRPVDISLCFT